MGKVHLSNLRLRNNAGMNFPECYSGAKLLDCDKGRLTSAPLPAFVTCERCKRTKAFRAFGKPYRMPH